ncbi:GNAT family N-acetyltransferase [Actinoplanes sp. NPDC023714]|uniref:GNAT family N-acetyltransferase n=1 Tax=Actinoplanes sp. NPDC023714 TaxID=3154322 RepID=UPI00340DCBFB
MVTIRDLAGLVEWTAASALYRSVFGYTGPEWGLSPRLLAALRENAGTVIGAFGADGTLIGFCYGFTGVEAGEIYHYSQAAVVAPAAQGLGVGRLLKQAQARAARATGARSMRWTFDPYALRNAHFNFTVLGATGIRFLPDFYGEPGTDRILVEWGLESGAATRTKSSDSPDSKNWLMAPASDRFAAPEPQDRRRLRRQLMDRFAAGSRLAGVARTGDGVAYTFENGSS